MNPEITAPVSPHGDNPSVNLNRGELHIDLKAVARNYRYLQQQAGTAETAACVKANAYGLGLAPVAQTLEKAGCRTFFVADPQEGVALRALLPEARIYVLSGLLEETAECCARHALRPCLASAGQIAEWQNMAAAPAALHIDTGMNRLGVPFGEGVALLEDPQALKALGIDLVMSHLACADQPEHPLNKIQTERAHTLSSLTVLPFSLANSFGLFFSPPLSFDMVRPGIALYGGNPTPGRPNPMHDIVTFCAPIIQIRDVAAGETVGYGAAHTLKHPGRIAVVLAGYGDGLFRSLEKTPGPPQDGFQVRIGEYMAPVVGKISMDMITVDISHIPSESVTTGQKAEIIGKNLTIDHLATAAGTISYEVLTNLGYRHKRRYSPQPTDLAVIRNP